jgi:histidine ammonia-lyase/phenylalanine ammonia-lyase
MRITTQKIQLRDVVDFVFARRGDARLELSDGCRARVDAAHAQLLARLDRREPIYGVTTGFGDSVCNSVDPKDAETLQKNLIRYLHCGTGELMPRAAVRAMCVARLVSLTRGHSGVSWELIERLRLLLERDLLPDVPIEGSLGASGDLVPLAYLAEVVQGEGVITTPSGARPTSEVFAELGIAPYPLKAKEGLSIVNGTSAMAGMALLNHVRLRYLLQLAQHATAWTCLVLDGNPEAFGELVNEKAKLHHGQRRIAATIRELLAAEAYPAKRAASTRQPLQDRYSLRCVPQVLGPILDTIDTVGEWIELELNSVSDNPLFDPDTGAMATGGNFYGGYLGHGMDYFKVCTANLVDLIDRQLMLLFDPKTCAGLPPNLAAWPQLDPAERHLHHGLKALHQVTNALASEVASLSMPATVFSRSSESHNQDKVSLGMSAAAGVQRMLDKAYSVGALTVTCLAQALDLRGISLQGASSLRLYRLVRSHVPFVTRDTKLGSHIAALTASLGEAASSEARLD